MNDANTEKLTPTQNLVADCWLERETEENAKTTTDENGAEVEPINEGEEALEQSRRMVSYALI